MNYTITQNHLNDNEISTKIDNFFKRFGIGSLLKMANCHKKKGFEAVKVFKYMFGLAFTNRSMYMDGQTGNTGREFAKDTVYRLMNATHINWMRFTTVLAATIIRKSVEPLTGDGRVNVLVIDDSTCGRDRSKKVELLTKIYDHSKKKFRHGFRMLTPGFTDGNTYMPINSVLLSSENPKSRVNGARPVDKRSVGHKRRQLSMTKGTEAMLKLPEMAKQHAIPASHVLFDSWFTSPKSLHAVRKIGYDVIAMVKRGPKMQFVHGGEKLSLPEIYRRNRKRRGRSRYLLSVTVSAVKDGKSLPAKVVYVRNRGNRKDYLCIISTDTALSEDEIIRIYGKRWDIEVFFKVCKSYLRLGRECHSLSHDAMTAHTAVVFARYMMLSIENRESRDERSLGELFIMFSDEMADITWVQSFHLLMDFLRNEFADAHGLSCEVIGRLIDSFMEVLNPIIKKRLGYA